MITTWILRAVLASAGFAVAAVLAEQIAAFFGKPRRWVWGVAMVASLFVPLAARLVPGIMPALGVEPTTTTIRAEGETSTGIAAESFIQVTGPVVTSEPTRRFALNGIAWIACSLALFLGALLVLRRLFALRDAATPAVIDGVSVRMTGTFGPGVVGYRQPAILIPRWAADAPPDQRRLILLHEREHIAGGDHWLFAFGAALVVAMPWNPIVWWQHRRLRLAIETDCDARVVARGADRRAYGHALIHAVRAAHPLTLLSLAWGHRASDLERRIRAMTAPLPRLRALRAVPLAIAIGLLTVLACDATEADPARVAGAELPDRAAGSASAAAARPRDTTFFGLPGEGYVRVSGHTRERMPAQLRIVSHKGRPMRVVMEGIALASDSVFEINLTTPQTFRIVGRARYRVVARAVEPGSEVSIEATAPVGFGYPRAASARGPAPQMNFTGEPTSVSIPTSTPQATTYLADTVALEIRRVALQIEDVAPPFQNAATGIARVGPMSLPRQSRDTASLEPGTLVVWSKSGRAERVVITTDAGAQLIRAHAVWSSRARPEGGHIFEVETPVQLRILPTPFFIARFDAVNPDAVLESIGRGTAGSAISTVGGSYTGGFAICGNSAGAGIFGPIKGPITDARNCFR